eukprot:g13450.t1
MRRLTEDPYLTLGVEPVADEATIKKAYRKLALRYHPDKNKATSTLFQAVQGAHDVLIEPDKRAEYDLKRKRQQEALNRLRKHPKGPTAGTPAYTSATTTGASKSGPSSPSEGAASSPTGRGGTKQTSSPHSGTGGNRAATGSTTGAGGRGTKKATAASEKGASRDASGEPAASSGDEKVRQFNKRFYEEFRREAKKHDKSKASSRRASGTATGTSKHQPPSRPKMRSTNRTDCTVTLEWHCSGLPSTTAFELQWRQRGRSASDWVTSPTLIVGKSCRKKNLAPCTCYEFRVRAASAWGWSGHCDPVMVVTLPAAAESGGGVGDGTSTSPRQKVSGFQSDGIGGSPTAAERAKAQIEEARRRRSQSQASHTKPSVQFRSSSIAGNDEAEGAEEAYSRSKKESTNAAADGQRNAGGVDSSGGGGGAAPPGMEKTNSWSYQPVNLDRIRTDNATSGSPLNSARRSSIGARSRSRSTTPTEDATKAKTQPSSGERDSDKTAGEAASKTSRPEPEGGISEKVPSIRVYSVPSQRGPSSGRGVGADDGIRVSASTAHPGSDSAAAGEGGAKDPADVWEFTEGDLDNIGAGATTYGSDDEWSYASGAGGLDTMSDPGDADTYRRRSSTEGAKQRRRSSAAAGRGRHGGDSGDGDNGDGEVSPKRYLNGRITKLHNVRAEPIRDAKVVGYLIATKEVQVLAEVGNWIKVRWHKRAKGKSQQDTPSSPSSSSSKKFEGPAAPASSATSTPRSSASAAAGDNEKDGGGGSREDGSEAGEADGVEEASEDGAEKGTGWCVTRDNMHKYIVTIGPEDADSGANRRPSSAKSSRKKSSTGRRRSSVAADRTSGGLDRDGSASAGGIEGGDQAGDGGGVFGEDGDEGECWHELKDEDGSVYYFNAASGMSQWEPPLWLDEIDPTTGAVYYVNSHTGDPQWERPEDFVPIVRENPYATTPEQDFIKSVLSPKRSKGPKSFHEAMYKTKRAGGSAQHFNNVSEGVAGGGGNEKSKDAAAA